MALRGSLGSNDMLMMDACEVEYQVGAGRRGNGVVVHSQWATL